MKDSVDQSLATKNLQLFGKINASISHELKNIFAIISETTGFIDDLTQLARQGKTFDFSVLENCNASIAEEIERGFHAIRQMNRFAHSVDDPVAETDITESFCLAIKLSQFLSYAVPVELLFSEEKVIVRTNAFLVLCVFYELLCELYKAGESDRLTASIKEVDGGACLVFTDLPENLPDPFPSEALQKTGDLLGVKWQLRSAPYELRLEIPPVSQG